MIFSCFAICGTTASAAETTGSTAPTAPTGPQYAQDDIRGSAVLHCFNWTYNNIRTNLADIAAAGYTAVQTSPVQQHKDYMGTGNYSYTGQWWKLYQPLSISIAPEGTSYLGSPDDLEDLCTAADTYGIKVIVDIVANHMANNGTDGGTFAKLSPNVEADLQDEDYYHTDASYYNDSSRYNLTQRHMNMPDLKTQDEYIQERFLQLLKDCVDLGVDGFRFDAAKHIELPTDSASFRGNFWPYVTNGIRAYAPDVYIYGEILGSAGTDISNYTAYMDVTDNQVGTDARNGVVSNSASTLAKSAYNKNAGATKSVLWAESHDDYTHNLSTNVTDAQIVNTWAIIGARADAMALYLARPNDIMGAASSDETWKSDEVAEVNKFKNFFDGTGEYLSSTGKAAYIERGTKGVVISKLDGAGAVSLTAHSMTSGYYIDQITGNVFTVANGVISGVVGESGVAVVYNPDGDFTSSTTAPPIPTITTNPSTINVYFTDALGWGAANVYYWGSTSDPQWPGNAMTVYETNSYGQKVYKASVPANVTGIIFNGGGKQTVDITDDIENGTQWYTNGEMDGANYKVTKVADPIIEGTTAAKTTVPGTTVPGTTVPGTTTPATTINVYFTDAQGWGTANVYYWGTSSDPQWPGSAMSVYETNSYGQKVYKATIPAGATGVIFNGNNKQTVDITTGIENGAQWYTNGEMDGANYKVTKVDGLIIEGTTVPGTTVPGTTVPGTTVPGTTVPGTTVPGTTVPGTTVPGTTVPVGTINVYFTDAQGWGAANVYYWGTSSDPQWPGSAMSVYETNSYGQKVYKATIPAGVTGVIFNGNNKQTVDILTGIENGAQWYTNGEMDGANYKVTKVDSLIIEGTTVPGTTVPGTTVPGTTVPGTTTPVTTINVYFTDAQGWGSANAYYWGTTSDPQWPGSAMSVYETNSYGQKVYKATIPAGVTGVIFNGNGKQTVDITEGIENGAQWYTNGEMDGANYKVTKVDDLIIEGTTVPGTTSPTTVPGTTVPGTTTPVGTIKVRFTDALSWDDIHVYYWGTTADPEWPGDAMTYQETNDFGQKIYQATIPANVSGVIFDGNGKQTVDITTGIGNNSWWYTNGETNGTNYEVTRIYGPDPVESTVPVTTINNSTAPSSSIAPGGEVIVYFTDVYNWGNLKIYYWGTGNDPQWPGVDINPSYINEYDQQVYSASFPRNAEGIIFTNGNFQTVDITTNLMDAVHWYPNGEMDDYKYEVTAIIPCYDTTTAPTTVPGTTVPGTTAPTGNINVYFTDAQGWGAANVYYWGTSSDPQWPGPEMSVYETNSYGQKVYKATIPANVTGVIFNGNGKQTVDIKTGIENGAQWYTNGEMDGANYKVTKVDNLIIEGTTVPGTTVPGTTVPAGNINVYFTDAQGWGSANVYYWGTTSDPQWPGSEMSVYETNSYGQKVYKASIPAGVTGVIFNGNGKQTVDITEGIENGAQWYTNGEMDGANYKVTKVDGLIIEGTTAAPTTIAPTTIAPTTIAPTTVEPTTVEPDTKPAPQPGDTTIKLVVPNNINSAYAWNDARLYYNTTGKSADNQYINMTATDETYYMTELGSGISSIANAGAWKVFTVTITEQQAAVIDNAQWVGFNNGNNRNRTVFEKAKNVFKAGIGSYTANYSTDKVSVTALKDYTFIIKDNNSTSSPYSSFLGYWTSDFTTVMMAAPMSDNSYSNWNEVSLSYGQSGDSETAIPMFNTGNTTKVSDIGDMSTLRAGRWYIYAVTLDAAQTAAVNSAARVGFVKPTGNNRTAGSKNVLKAKTNSFDGNYNSTARTLEELEGQLFVVKAKASANSVVIYNGEWQTEDVYTAGNNDTVTIYFAAPKGADKTTAGWDTGVQLYYGTTTAYQNCTKVDMTPVNTTRNVSVAGTGLTTLKSGNWDVYAIELDAQMISTIDAATTVGFIKKGSYNRTSALYTKNIAKAPTTEDGTYTKNKQSIETFDGKTFVINTCADSKNERTSYMGIWS